MQCWVFSLWIKRGGRRGFPNSSVVKNLPDNAGNMGSIPDPGRSHMPRATKPMCRNYRVCALEPGASSTEPMCPRACVLQRDKETTLGRKHKKRKRPTKTNTKQSLFSSLVMSNSLWLHGLQHIRLPCPLQSPRVVSNSSPLSQWCYRTILSAAAPFSLSLQSFPASRCF